MLVQCIMSMPYEEVDAVELPEGPAYSDSDLDLAQYHHRGYGGGYRRGGVIIIAGGYRRGGYGYGRR